MLSSLSNSYLYPCHACSHNTVHSYLLSLQVHKHQCMPTCLTSQTCHANIYILTNMISRCSCVDAYIQAFFPFTSSLSLLPHQALLSLSLSPCSLLAPNPHCQDRILTAATQSGTPGDSLGHRWAHPGLGVVLVHWLPAKLRISCILLLLVQSQEKHAISSILYTCILYLSNICISSIYMYTCVLCMQNMHSLNTFVCIYICTHAIFICIHSMYSMHANMLKNMLKTLHSFPRRVANDLHQLLFSTFLHSPVLFQSFISQNFSIFSKPFHTLYISQLLHTSP